MTVQEAINDAKYVLKKEAHLYANDLLRYPISPTKREWIGVLIRAAEENEGRKLAEKWKADSCRGCPIDCHDEDSDMPCCMANKYLELWVEAAKKVG